MVHLQKVPEFFLHETRVYFCVVYDFRLFIMLRHFPIESRGRQKKLEEVCAYV